MLNKNRFDVALKIKSVSETGEFSGYGSVFGVKDSYGDVVVPGAFTESLEDWQSKSAMPAMLWQHDTSEPIGVYTAMKEDESGLVVEGRLLIDDDPLAKRAHAHLKAGSISGLSIGYSLAENGYHWDKDKQAFVLTKIDLWEVSLVTFPANDEARVQDVKRALTVGETPQPKLVERVLRDAGFTRQQAKTFMAKGYGALNQRDADPDCLESLNQLTNIIKGQTHA